MIVKLVIDGILLPDRDEEGNDLQELFAKDHNKELTLDTSYGLSLLRGAKVKAYERQNSFDGTLGDLIEIKYGFVGYEEDTDYDGLTVSLLIQRIERSPMVNFVEVYKTQASEPCEVCIEVHRIDGARRTITIDLSKSISEQKSAFNHVLDLITYAK